MNAIVIILNNLMVEYSPFRGVNSSRYGLYNILTDNN